MKYIVKPILWPMFFVIAFIFDLNFKAARQEANNAFKTLYHH